MRRFLGWCEGEGIELVSISPGMVGHYRTGPGGSASKLERICIATATVSLRSNPTQIPNQFVPNGF